MCIRDRLLHARAWVPAKFTGPPQWHLCAFAHLLALRCYGRCAGWLRALLPPRLLAPAWAPAALTRRPRSREHNCAWLLDPFRW
eukprot:6963299-Alexandrium_andersonii.AAC.1